jgi:cytochrome P450
MTDVDLSSFGTSEMLECPFPFFKEMRASAPVVKLPGREAFLVTRREDIEYVTLHPELFSSTGRSPAKTYPGQRYKTLADMTSTDPPEHTAMRSVHLRMLSTKKLAAMKPEIEREANRLIEAFEEADEIELISEYAAPLPSWVMTALLGIPREMQSQLDEWADKYFTFFDANLHSPGKFADIEDELVGSYVDFMNFCGELVEERLANPGEDPLTSLVTSTKRDGSSFTVDELANFVRLLIVGAQTTVTMIAHAVQDLLSLDSVPDLSDDRIVRRLLEESMRMDGPTTYGPRIVTEDVEIGGVELRAGTRILLSWQSANRDGDFFADPDTFDPQRENLSRHMAFGNGIHRCIGAPLAHLEGEVALRALFGRLPHLMLSGRNTFEHDTGLMGIRKLDALYVDNKKR